MYLQFELKIKFHLVGLKINVNKKKTHKCKIMLGAKQYQIPLNKGK